MPLRPPFRARFSASHLLIVLIRVGFGLPLGLPLALLLGPALQKTFQDVRSGRGWDRRAGPLRQVGLLTRDRRATILQRLLFFGHIRCLQ